jgi:integrating conjugative element protein (TIGR03759 family)
MKKAFGRSCLTALLMVAAMPSGAADSAQTAASSSRDAESASADHGDAATLGQFSREQWSLNEAEWTRYQTLMRGMRGSVSPATLSPIEVLGIHAQTEAERKDYARRWAKLMHEDAARILAFQAAYTEASRELNPGGPIIDTAALPGTGPQNTPAEWVLPGDRVLLFMPLDCFSCAGFLRAAREASGKGAQVDVYVTGSATDRAILDWAAAQGFDPRAVQARKTTFNREHGELATVVGLGASPPKMARLRNRVATLVEPDLSPKP